MVDSPKDLLKLGRRWPRSTALKVLLLGDSGVGKSCLMNRFVRDQFDSHVTVGVEFLKKDVVLGGETYTLQIWDTAGQERFRSLRTPFFRGTDICILTYSVDDKSTFDDLSGWVDEFLNHADVKDSRSFPFVLVGNKADVTDDRRKVTVEDTKEWRAKHGDPPVLETSAKDATNVDLIFNTAVQRWIQLEATPEDSSPNSTVNLKQLSKSYSCCNFTKIKDENGGS